MKRLLVGLAVLSLAAPAIAAGPDKKGNGAPKGKFEKFLLVAPGNPNTQQQDLTHFLSSGAETSGGKAIFIPVKTTQGPNEIYCQAADPSGSFIIGDVANENLVAEEPTQGVRINFVKSLVTSLTIADRDATDGYAEVDVPQDWADATSVDLYVRVLGKPGGCIQSDAYTFDGNDYFYAGTAVFKRKAGQSTFVDTGELTNVYYCPDGYSVVNASGNTYQCYNGVDYTDAVQTNVFASVFDEYFWQVTNDGVRVMQVLMRANFD